MKLLLFLFLLTGDALFAQEDAWVYFSDKPDTAFYLENPLEMLSQKALGRRAAQGTALDDKDVPVHQPYINGIAGSQGITVMAKSKWLNAVHVRGSAEAIHSLTILPYVESIDFANNQSDNPDRPAHWQQTSTVTKTLDIAESFSYGTSASQVEMLNGHLLHEQGYTGSGLTIAVLDAGFPGVNSIHPFERLRDNNRIVGGYNFLTRSDGIYTGNQHGTLVLSVMGGYSEGNLIGTAPDASYYLFVTEDSTGENPLEESLWVEAAEMADSLGVDIINTSLGYFNYDNPDYSYTYQDMDGQTAFITRGANVAFTRGMLCVTSAGNSGNDPDAHIQAPADAFNTLAVGAVNAQEGYANFSSIGPSYDLRIKPDVMAQGAPGVVVNAQGTVTSANGTSISSPIIAGLAACLWQALPDYTNAQILQLIKESADRFANPDAQYGYGIPDFAQALEDALGISSAKRDTFLLHPNPAQEILQIKFPKGLQNASVTVFNNLGQLVLQESVSKNNPSLSVEGLSTGIYSYRIESGQQSITGRFVKE